MVILRLKMSVLRRQIEWYACGTSATNRTKVRAVFQPNKPRGCHFWVLGDFRGVILGLKMSVLTRQIEWYACGTSATDMKKVRAVFQPNEAHRNNFGVMGGFRGSWGGHIAS